MEDIDRRFRFCNKRNFSTMEAMLLRVLDICKASDTAAFAIEVHKSDPGVSLELASIRLRVVVDLLIHILLPSCGVSEDLVTAKETLRVRLQGIEVHKYSSLSVGLKSPKLPVTSFQSVYAI